MLTKMAQDRDPWQLTTDFPPGCSFVLRISGHLKSYWENTLQVLPEVLPGAPARWVAK